MQRMFKLIFSLLTLAILTACSPKSSDFIVADYDNAQIDLNEFLNAYHKDNFKSNFSDSLSTDSLSKMKNFLDLYTNYKMKLRDAFVRGYDEDPELQKEINDYQKKVGIEYLKKKYLIEPGIKQLYNRRKYEVRASHILLLTKPATEKEVEKFAYKLIDSLNHGADFADFAKKYSIDPYTKNDGGDLYYLTGGMLTLPRLEDAIYETEPGYIYQKPIKTKFGYHILKVTEKHKRVAEVRVSLIFTNLIDSTRERNEKLARSRIEKIKEELDNGADFEELARKYSDDEASAKKGGDLGYLRRRLLPRSVDSVAFRLDVGKISEILRSPNGFSIIKVTGVKNEPPLEEERKSIFEMYKTTHFQYDLDTLMTNFEKEFNFVLNDSTLNSVASKLDSVKFENYQNSQQRELVRDSALFSIENFKIDCDSVINFVSNMDDFKNKRINRTNLEKALKKLEYKILYEQKALVLDKSEPEFAELMNNYKNGVYLFKLMEDEVWNKVKVDTNALPKLYKETKNNYKWEDRVSYTEIFARRDSLIQSLYDLVLSGMNFDSVAVNYSQKSVSKFELVDVDQTEVSMKANSISKVGDYSKPFKSIGGFSIVRLDGKEPARLKTYEEAKPELASLYQEMESKRLEQEYINRLKKIYKPELHYDVLQNYINRTIN